MGFFDVQIEDNIQANPFTITLSSFVGVGGITAFCIFELKSLSLSGLALTTVPQYLTVSATSGSTAFKSDNTAQTIIGVVKLSVHDDITYYYEGNDNDDKFVPVRLGAGATTIVLTFKDQSGASVTIPSTFQNCFFRARIVGQ